MLKASAKIGQRDWVLLGLSDENVRRLCDDKPIKVDLREFGVDALVVIFNGPTEEKMAEMFDGAIGPDTTVSIDERLFGGSD